MSLKNYLDNWINQDYFKLLLKRHMSLGIIPLVVFMCLLFLHAILGLEMGALAVFLIPYALAIVPLSALILFKSYTKKSDLAYLASIPLTRKQLFMTTYLVGLLIVQATLLIMTTITFMGIPGDLIRAVIAFLGLGLIYYTFACLGCMLGGKSITQFINMGIICFGPVILYLISKMCIGEIAFGHFSGSYNDSLLMIICPLISAADFLTGDGWSYWWAHILLVAGMLWLSIYLIRHRHFESDQLERLTKWILKPVIYLNITYVLFIICYSATLGSQHYYNWSFYIKTIALLVGVSVLVSCLMSIWSSKSIHMIIKKDNLLYQSCLIIISCIFMIIPLWQTEKERYEHLHDHTSITFIPPNNHWYDAVFNKSEATKILNILDEQRDLIVNVRQYGQIENEARILFEGQSYIFNLDEVNQPLIQLCETILLRARENEYLFSDYGHPLQDSDIIIENSKIYKKASVISAYKNTYENKLTKEFLNKLIIDWQKEEQYDRFYPITFTSMDYNEWKSKIYKDSEVLFNEKEWNDICDIVVHSIENIDSIEVTSKYAKDILERSNSMKIDESAYWQVVEAKEDYVRMHVGTYVYMIEDYQNEDITLFEDSEVSLSFDIELRKDNQQWIPIVRGVYYR